MVNDLYQDVILDHSKRPRNSHPMDDANRKAAQAELFRQARAPTPMRIAREATRRAVERNFALPLRAAGLDARVIVRFPDEGRSAEQMDRSTPLNEALAR